MEDRRITYAVSNFSSDNGGDTSKDVNNPGTVGSDSAGGPDETRDAASGPAPLATDAGARVSEQEAEEVPATSPEPTAKPGPAAAAPSEPPALVARQASSDSAPTRSNNPASALPVMALSADDPETHIDEARLRSALALRKLPLSPRQFYTRQRANVVSLLVIIAAVGAAGWYATNEHSTEPVVSVRDKKAPRVQQAGFIPVKPLAPALYSVPLPKIDRSVLLSLGELEYKMEPGQYIRFLRVQKGDTFSEVLNRVGVPIDEANSAIGAMRTIFDPRKMRPGLKVAVTFGNIGDEQSRFLGVKFDSSFDKTVQVQRQPDGEFASAELKKELDVGYARSNGVIKSSLFQDARRAQAPAAAILQMIHLFSFAIDFQRDIREGDEFEILYRVHRDQNGNIVRTGEVAYASLTVRGTAHRLYRFRSDKKSPATYLNEKGEGNRKALMKTPIDGARLTSNFGMRRHPILGYSRMHTGTDFGAPTGTPIYAAGDGTILIAGWKGGYGKYVRIRHNKEYMTAYAHMSKLHVKVGQRVKQGQVIGRVGTTGRSTGPHLHYEVLRHGKFVNPATITLPSFKRLQGQELARFKAAKGKLDAIYTALGRSGNTGRLLTVKANPDGDCKNGLRLDPTDTRPCE